MRGDPLLPRIAERRPYPGDVHPISKGKLARMLRGLPAELYYGLRLIEMRARQGPVGEPFAEYSRQAKTIRLYSLPPAVHFARLASYQRRLLDACGATVTPEGSGHTVLWPDTDAMGFWFFLEVFLHELEHHYRMQYPYKTGRPRRRREEEFLAERGKFRIARGR